ncbi:hypothetical protein H0H87_004069 [Tephrocybe sp. NHM501043]|nr:hypothetical protein H0H87_004069 [Tephrocybe sp. NHM501043]
MSQTPSDIAEGVPFSLWVGYTSPHLILTSLTSSSFCSLLREISKAPSHRAAAGHNYRTPDYPALNIFRRWTKKLRADFFPLPPGATAIVFNFLFPSDDHHRRFDMQETRLSHNIAETFGIDKRYLDNWLSDNSSGCLGEELKLVLERTSTACVLKLIQTVGGHISPLSISQVDELLDELSATSGYTDGSIRKKYPLIKRRKRLAIIKDLFRTLSPIDAGFLTQIILKDLRPLLYPLRETHYIASLLGHNTTSVRMLSKEDAMNVWDASKWMLNLYRVKSTFTEAANDFEKPPNERGRNVPKIGVPVVIPKSEKGRSPRHALTYFRNSHQVWAETKYDGERAQIHVEIQRYRTNITIFSKSKRDSTLDRAAIHDVIYRALGLSKFGVNEQSRVKTSVILDAEMVVFHKEDIEEFWRIRGLVEETALGIRKRKRVQMESQADSEACSQTSMQTDYSDDWKLGLVFFDVLSLDSKSLLMTPYGQRREILERIIQVIPGQCILAERIPIGLRGVYYKDLPQVIALERVFANSISRHLEGLVLKGEETKYHDFLMPWVKLKKDYIPGYGDTVDMAIVGVSWERERGRVLRVPPSTMTTFYIGGVENPEEILHQKTHDLKYTFSLLPSLAPPKFILKEPLLAELFGAGFTRAPKSKHYELRFPRVTKVHRPSERPWTEGVNLKELHKIACKAVGRDTSDKQAKDVSAEIWGITASPGAKSVSQREVSYKKWRKELADMDGREPTSDDESVSPSQPPLPLAMRSEFPIAIAMSPVIKASELKIASQSPPTPKEQAEKSATQPLGTMTNVVFSQASSLSDTRSPSLKPMHVIPFSPPSTPSPQKRRKTIQPTRPKASVQPPECTPAASVTRPSFLENSVVWFAKPRGESWGLKSAVPRGQRIHSIEALLAGCGWCADTQGTSWAEKGVLFVDDGSMASKEMARRVLDVITERLRVLPAGRERKPIWMFNQRTWTTGEDVEKTALYRFQ